MVASSEVLLLPPRIQQTSTTTCNTNIKNERALSEGRHKPAYVDDLGRCFYFHKGGTFAITKPIDGEPATHANGGTIGFAAESTELVDEWHAVGVVNGGTSIEEPPGVRNGPKTSLYLAYLRDPSGNKICAMHRMPDS